MKLEQFVRTLVLMGSTAGLGIGCVAHAQAGAYGEADAPVVFKSAPTLVEIDSDVWVVRDHERAVYYAGNYYWVYRDGIWWRAQAYDGGWTRIEASAVPTTIANRDHSTYANYRGSETARTRPAPREHLASEPSSGRGHDDDKKNGPPDHAAAQHGGPPGQNEGPGLGNQRKAEEGNQRPERNDAPPPHADKKDEKKDEKKDDKKGPPPKKK
jgi:hypothetical protein